MKTEKNIRILLIEGSQNNAALLLNEIERRGYKPKYEILNTYDDISDAIPKGKWDIILADYEFSGIDLFNILGMLKRSNLNTPPIVVSNVSGEEVVVSLIKAGADNCVMKK